MLSRFVRCLVFVLGVFHLPLTAAAPLSLAEAQIIAAGDAPQVLAQSSSLRAAQQSSLSAGELPDPKLIVGIDNLPTESSDRFSFTRDFMTMRKIGFMQEFTRNDKLKLKSERANAEVRRQEAQLTVVQLNLKRDVALAWIDLHFARRQQELLSEMAQTTSLQTGAAQAALAGGKALAAESYTARLASEQIAERSIDAERLIARARANLARWIGAAAQRELDAPPAFDRLAHSHAVLLDGIDSHPHLAMLSPSEAVAQSEARLAQVAAQPDWSVEVAYAQRGPAYTNMLSLAVKIDLPILQSRRQNPEIASRLALVEQVRAQNEDTRRAHAAEVKSMLADWVAAKSRLQRFETSLQPLAHERAEVTLAAYRGGKGELIPLIEARKGEIETRMNRLQAEADLARAWAGLNFLLPDKKESP